MADQGSLSFPLALLSCDGPWESWAGASVAPGLAVCPQHTTRSSLQSLDLAVRAASLSEELESKASQHLNKNHFNPPTPC